MMDQHRLVEAMSVAIECNNIGVDLLENGCPSEALGVFRETVKLMNPASRSFKESQHDHTTVDPPLSESETMKAIERAIRHTQQLLQSAHQRIDRGGNPTNDSMLLTPPLKIPRLASVPCSCTKNSAIVVYNMGLACFRNGTERSLRKSLCLFDMAYTLASTQSHDRSSLKVCMASLNNSGQIHYSLTNYDLEQRYLQNLSNMVLSNPSTDSVDDIQERQQFLLNALLLREPCSAGAA
jgi:hypothetical protein